MEHQLGIAWGATWRICLAVIAMTDTIQDWLGIVLVIVTIAYTLYKWAMDIKDRKKKKAQYEKAV